MKKRGQRIVVAIIAIMLVAVMVLSLFATAGVFN